MKLKEYIKNLQEIEKEYGGDLIIVYSADDEGNYFDQVHFSPTIGEFDADAQEFYPDRDDDDRVIKINSVLIN